MCQCLPTARDTNIPIANNFTPQFSNDDRIRVHGSLFSLKISRVGGLGSSKVGTQCQGAISGMIYAGLEVIRKGADQTPHHRQDRTKPRGSTPLSFLEILYSIGPVLPAECMSSS